MALKPASFARASSAGVIGAAAVALLILVFDIASRTPLLSPGHPGLGDPEGRPRSRPRHVSCGAVLGYTVVHGLGFIVVGLIAVFLVAAAEREPAMVLAVLIFFAAFEVFFLALIAFWALPVLGVLAWWEILAGNLVASTAMLYDFHRCHPGLGAEPDRPVGRRRARRDRRRVPRRLGGRGLVPPVRRDPPPAAPHAGAPRRRGASGAPRSRAPDPAAGRRGGVHHLPLRRLRGLRDRRRRLPFAAEREPRILLGPPRFSSSASRCSSSGSSRRSTSCSPASSPGGTWRSETSSRRWPSSPYILPRPPFAGRPAAGALGPRRTGPRGRPGARLGT